MMFAASKKAWDYERKLNQPIEHKITDRLNGILDIVKTKIITDIAIIICDYLNPSIINKITVYGRKWIYNENNNSGFYLPVYECSFSPFKNFLNVVYDVSCSIFPVEEVRNSHICCTENGLVPGINFPAYTSLYNLISEDAEDLSITLIFSPVDSLKMARFDVEDYYSGPSEGELNKIYNIPNIICKDWPSNLNPAKYTIGYINARCYLMNRYCANC